MKLAPLAVATLAVLALASAVPAQDPDPAYQPQQDQAFRFAGDTLARYEWTRNLATPSGLVPNQDRYRLQARPRLELTAGPVQLGVGGEFNYSEDENDVAPPGQSLTIIRDNYRSRDARLELAWAKVKLGPAAAQGGRFFMPIPLTEMIWDRDLRAQGGAVTVTLGDAQSAGRLSLYGLYSFGSHVFDDEGEFLDPTIADVSSTNLWSGAAELSLGRAGESTLSVLAAYLKYDHLNSLEPPIRRQNTRVAGLIVPEYEVWDIVGRLARGGQVPAQLVVDYCWNSAVSVDNNGLWLAAVLGGLGVSPARLEYVYSKVDKDATLAAYATDDFLWGTGWEGHKVELGVSTRKNNSVHGIAQWQRFKDAPDPIVRDEWATRYRLEWRTRF
jgi:hypothetical protein